MSRRLTPSSQSAVYIIGLAPQVGRASEGPMVRRSSVTSSSMICWMNSCAFSLTIPLERLPHRPAGRTLGSRDILSHEATFLSPGCHPGSLV